MRFLNLDQPDPRRSRFVAERTSKWIPYSGRKEKARRLKQLAETHARLVAKLESPR